MTVVTDRIRQRFDVPVGINVLANAPIPAFAIAAAGSARFIRVNEWANACVAHEGFIEGRAGEPLRFRAKLRQDGIRVFADSHVKHGAHAIAADRSIEEPTRNLALFDADAGIATGQRTGDSARPDEIRTIRDTPHLPLPVGSGVSEANIGEILALTDGVIIASSMKVGGVWWIPVDPARVRSFVARTAERRSTLLEEFRAEQPIPIHAVYPHRRHLAPKVTAFIDFILEKFTPPPWEVLGSPPSKNGNP